MKRIILILMVLVMETGTSYGSAWEKKYYVPKRPLYSKTIIVKPIQEDVDILRKYIWKSEPDLYYAIDAILGYREGCVAPFMKKYLYPRRHGLLEWERIYEQHGQYFRAYKLREESQRLCLKEDLEAYLVHRAYLDSFEDGWSNKSWFIHTHLFFMKHSNIKIKDEIINGMKWKIADPIVTNENYVFEYIPKKSERQSTKELYTVGFAGKLFAKDLAEYERKFNEYNKQFKNILKLNYYEKELARSKDGYTRTWGFGEGYENAIEAVKQVKDGYYRVSYTKLTPLSEEEIQTWQKILEERIKSLE